MTNQPLITFIIGTRPEAIKLAFLIKIFKKSDLIKIRVLSSGQHLQMVKEVMDLFNLKIDKNLRIMQESQTLSHITERVLKGLEDEFKLNKPDMVFVQGDTSTAFSAALESFYHKIPVAHVEAGLRTGNIMDPYPEEVNRRMISQLSTLHFAPTDLAMNNLKREKVEGEIFLTGNTVIDSLKWVSKKVSEPKIKGIDWNNDRVIFSTIHRRENWGANIKNIIIALTKIIDTFQDIKLLLPLHKNPIVRNPIKDMLGDHPRAILTEPIRYDTLVGVMERSYLILTDSGGLQEEAPTFGKPVLVLRETTERQEAVNAGTAKLVGTNSDNIFNSAKELLTSKDKYNNMSKALNPYGDGQSSERILKNTLKFLKLKS